MVPAICSAQKTRKTVTGTVYDEDDCPQMVCSVRVVGEKTGTYTNYYGQYEISVPENGMLDFFFFGYETQRISVKGVSEVNVHLKLLDWDMKVSLNPDLFDKDTPDTPIPYRNEL